ncbi:MAG: 50S ribosomal protein L15 [Bacteroidota bacterium]
MQLHTLQPALGATKARKRIGRGPGSGKGGTSTRGHKGAQSRSGYKRKRGFEGGQLPLQRRLPMYGFKNPNRVAYKPINLEQLQQLADKAKLAAINVEVLRQHGLISKNDRYKILGQGELKAKLEVAAHAFSASAQAAIEKAGGQTATIDIHA